MNTIQEKIGSKSQKNAPFSSQVSRFYEPPCISDINLEQIMNNTNRKSFKEDRKGKISKSQPKGLMGSSQPRFDK